MERAEADTTLDWNPGGSTLYSWQEGQRLQKYSKQTGAVWCGVVRSDIFGACCCFFGGKDLKASFRTRREGK